MLALSLRKSQASDWSDLIGMRASLWPDTPVEELDRELDPILQSGMSGTLPATILVAQDESGSLIGFLEVGLRSHADGCDPAHAVGYIEGWFVQETFRNHGVGKELMRAAEDWARGHGCVQMASDTWIDNEASQRAHLSLGFEVVDRCVNFRKAL
jgi:aminoglycoside 6'-N-acetyltransferase I